MVLFRVAGIPITLQYPNCTDCIMPREFKILECMSPSRKCYKIIDDKEPPLFEEKRGVFSLVHTLLRADLLTDEGPLVPYRAHKMFADELAKLTNRLPKKLRRNTLLEVNYDWDRVAVHYVLDADFYLFPTWHHTIYKDDKAKLTIYKLSKMAAYLTLKGTRETTLERALSPLKSSENELALDYTPFVITTYAGFSVHKGRITVTKTANYYHDIIYNINEQIHVIDLRNKTMKTINLDPGYYLILYEVHKTPK